MPKNIVLMELAPVYKRHYYYYYYKVFVHTLAFFAQFGRYQMSPYVVGCAYVGGVLTVDSHFSKVIILNFVFFSMAKQ